MTREFFLRKRALIPELRVKCWVIQEALFFCLIISGVEVVYQSHDLCWSDEKARQVLSAHFHFLCLIIECTGDDGGSGDRFAF